VGVVKSPIVTVSHIQTWKHTQSIDMKFYVVTLLVAALVCLSASYNPFKFWSISPTANIKQSASPSFGCPDMKLQRRKDFQEILSFHEDVTVSIC
jgi:hypothetical protein